MPQTVHIPDPALRDPGQVWCDAHGELHEPEEDFYGDETEGCEPEHWETVEVRATGRYEP